MIDPLDWPREKEPPALGGEERVVWDNGEIRLTTKAVLLAADTNRPRVVPLQGISEARAEYGCLVLCTAEGDVWSSVLDSPEKLVELVKAEVQRAHLSRGA
jgi:hypothetical protein